MFIENNRRGFLDINQSKSWKVVAALVVMMSHISAGIPWYISLVILLTVFLSWIYNKTISILTRFMKKKWIKTQK